MSAIAPDLAQIWPLPLPGLVGRQVELPQAEVADCRWLSSREQACSAALGPWRRQQWLAGRQAAKAAVAAWCQHHWGIAWPWAQLEILPTPLGQPVLHHPALSPRTRPTLSISHCQQRAVAIAGPPSRAIGVDIELLGRIQLDAMALAVSPEELACLPSPQNELT